MTSAFAPDGSEPMGRKLTTNQLRDRATLIQDFYKLDLVEQFLVGYEGFVALQLSDRLLSDSVAIIRHLRSRTQNCTFVIVGDSTYGDGDVDEISAQHVDCQKMVYFGNHNTKTKTSMNTLFIRVDSFDTVSISTKINEVVSADQNQNYSILCENENLLNLLNTDLKKQTLNLDDDLKEESSDRTIIFIGESSDPKIVAWSMQNQPKSLICIDKNGLSVTQNPIDTARLLMQRFYLIEKAKDAEKVGLVLGSNGGHELSLKCLSTLRKLALGSDKTPYTIVVGEPTPQKLANFPEMDIFVLVGSPEVSILPAKGFYKPVIHPWEFIMAATGKDWDGSFCANWANMLDDDMEINLKEHDISLITGKVRTVDLSRKYLDENTETSVMLKGSSEIATLACHSIRENREYFGLEQTKSEKATVITEGNMGIAQGYSKEKQSS